jgi:hypothetical protein
LYSTQSPSILSPLIRHCQSHSVFRIITYLVFLDTLLRAGDGASNILSETGSNPYYCKNVTKIKTPKLSNEYYTLSPSTQAASSSSAYGPSLSTASNSRRSRTEDLLPPQTTNTRTLFLLWPSSPYAPSARRGTKRSNSRGVYAGTRVAEHASSGTTK